MAVGTNEQGFLSGALAGGAAGAAAGPFGVAVGAVIGGTIGYLAADSQRKAQKKAMRRAMDEQERVRREGVVREMNARQQADSLAFAGQARNRGSSSNAPGVVGGQDAPGSIAANVSSSGTF